MSVFRRSRVCICVIDKIIKKYKNEGAFFTNRIAQKFLSVAVSLVFAVCMVPGCPACAQVETQVSIPQEVFMTKDEIMQLCADTNDGTGLLATGTDSDKKVLINFGTRPNKAVYTTDLTTGAGAEIREVAAGPIECFLAGSDGEDYVVLLLTKPICSANSFGSADLDSRFQVDQSEREYIPAADSGYPNAGEAITVPSNHYGASNVKKVLDSLPSNRNYYSEVEQTCMKKSTISCYDVKNRISYTVNSSLYLPDGINPKALVGENSQLVVANVYLDASSWSRYPHVNPSGGFIFSPESNLGGCPVDTNYISILPAFKVKMQSILFAAPAASGNADDLESFSKVLAGEPLSLRVSKLYGMSVAINDSTITYSASVGGMRLMVLVSTKDGATYKFAKNINTAVNNQTLNIANIAGLENLRGQDIAIKAWIERNEAGQAVYATDAVDSVVKAFKPATPANQSLFTGVLPDDLGYNGLEKKVEVTSNVTGTGEIAAIHCFKINEDGTTTPLSGFPINAGKYGATYDVGQGTNYGAAKGLRVIFVPQTAESN